MKKLIIGLFIFASLVVGSQVYAEPNPSNILISPVSGSTFAPGQTIDVRWNSSIQGFTYSADWCASYCFQDIIIKYNNIEVKRLHYVNNDGQETVQIPYNTPGGEYKVYLGWNNFSMMNNLSGEELVGTFYVTANSNIDNGCLYGSVYSYTTGQKCYSPITNTPSITVTSPNSGEIYQEGDIVRVRWSSINLPTDYRLHLVFNYLDELKDEYKQSALITKAEDRGYFDYRLPMFSQYKKSNYPLSGKYYEFSIYVFDSTYNTNSAIAVGSSGHGSNDGFFTIKPKTIACPPNMPNPLSMCPNSSMVPANYDSNGCVTSYKCINQVIDNGCSYGAVYSSTTGQRCSGSTVVDNGCSVGVLYSTTTGKMCSLDSSRVRLTKTWRWGDRGDEVKIIQRYFGVYADGVYGRGTMAKVKEWQIKNGLRGDGVFGSSSRVTAGLQ